MPSAWGAIAARVVNRIQTVANVGRVHEGDRLIKEATEMEDLAIVDVDGERRFRMWTVTLTTAPAEWEDAGGTVKWSRLVVVQGYLQFETGSATTPVTLAEAAPRARHADVRTTRFNGLVLYGGPCTLRANEPRQFGPMLCHYVRIECPVTTLET